MKLSKKDIEELLEIVRTCQDHLADYDEEFQETKDLCDKWEEKLSDKE